MAVDVLLKFMKEKKITHKRLAESLNINVATLYRKLNSSDNFTIGQAKIIVDVLGLSKSEAESIFFDTYVA